MSSATDILKVLGVIALIVVGVGFAVGQMGAQQHEVEKALRARGYENVSAEHGFWVVCWGEKNRYGYKWTATRNGQTVHGEACSGGLFQDTVIKP